MYSEKEHFLSLIGINMAWFFPAFWPWHGFSVPMVSYYRIVTTLESRAAPRSLVHACLYHPYSEIDT